MAPDNGVITQLNISHLRVDDGGLFACVAHHGDSMVVHHDRLNVYGEFTYSFWGVFNSPFFGWNIIKYLLPFWVEFKGVLDFN